MLRREHKLLSKLYFIFLINVGQQIICLFILRQGLDKFCLFHSGDLWMRIWKLLRQIRRYPTKKKIFFRVLRNTMATLLKEKYRGHLTFLGPLFGPKFKLKTKNYRKNYEKALFFKCYFKVIYFTGYTIPKDAK